MTAETVFFLAWLRRNAPSSHVLRYFEFPRLPSIDRRRFGSARAPALDRCRLDGGDGRALSSGAELELRRARLEHARRVADILAVQS
jgi:hypothetical protein